jgi:hypothetical protein
MKLKNRHLSTNFRSIFSEIGQIARASGAALTIAALCWGDVAQVQINLSPLSIDVQSKSGQAQGVIDVKNTGNTVFRARIYAEPFTYDRDTGFKTLTSTPFPPKEYG